MNTPVKTITEYLESLPEDRQAALQQLRKVIQKNLPKGFKETISYNMIGYVVPHTIYPDGYHCDPKLPLPFLNMASQKNYIAIYHMGLYSDKELLTWFEREWPKHVETKLDMGKSCIRFKKVETIPYDLLGELVAKVTVGEWIELYESSVKP